MSGPGTPTFEQLRIFLAVVDTGSFAGAARQLGRAVSVISYGIVNLEAQLGVALFERDGTRKPRLTTDGRALLAEARTISHGFDGLHAKVKGLREGLEAEVNLAVDVMLPAARLKTVLRAFAVAFPTVPLCLHVEALSAVTARVQSRDAVIGISGPYATGADDVVCTPAGAVAMIAVASPDHPLAQLGRIAPGGGRHHVRLALWDRSRLTGEDDASTLSDRTWRIADLGAMHALLGEGVGWGIMPVPLVEADLASGALVRLEMPDYQGEIYRFAGVWRRDTPPGTAAAWLLDEFIATGADDADLPPIP